MPIYILVTNYNYDVQLYKFDDNLAFLNWYSENCDQVESLQYMNPEKDILFVDQKNLEYAHVRYLDQKDPNKYYREIIAFDPSITYFEGSIAEYLVLHSQVIESFELIGQLITI